MDKQYGLLEKGYQVKKYDDILKSLQHRAIEEFGENVNLSENSPLGQFLMVIAYELSIYWEMFEDSYYKTHLLYAEGQNLDNLATNYAVERKKGTYATTTLLFKGENGTVIKAGTLVSTGNLIFETLDEVKIEDNFAEVEAEATLSGSRFNVDEGTITTIVNPSVNLYEVKNIKPARGGTDIETDEEFRSRVLKIIRTPLTGSNLAQYEMWALEHEGVGNAKALRATPSAGWTTVVVADNKGQAVSSIILQEVTQYIEEVMDVNARVSVENALSKDINISVNILSKTEDRDLLEESLTEDIEQFLESIQLGDDIVSYAKLGATILTNEYVLDYEELTLNGKQESLELEVKETPKLKSFYMGVL